VLFILVAYFKKRKKIRKKDWCWLIFRSLGGLVAFIAYYMAVNVLELGTTYFLFYASATISGFVIGKMMFTEKLNEPKIASLILSLIGIVLVYRASFDQSKLLYLSLAIVSGLGWTFWLAFAKKISGNYSALYLNFIDSFLSFAVYLIISVFLKESWVMPNFSKVWIANYVMALLMIITSQLVIYGFRRLEAQIGSLVMLNEILFGLLIGALLYKETIPLTSLLGGFLIVISSVVANLRFRRKKWILRS